jgi:translation initiation factor IF-2
MNTGKVRIYDLSKELNLDNRDLLIICEQLNILVKSHSSTITDEEAAQIRGAAAAYQASPAKSAPQPPRQSPNGQSNSKPKAPVQKKPQILEVRSKPNLRQSTPELSGPPTQLESVGVASAATLAPAAPPMASPPVAPAPSPVVPPSAPTVASEAPVAVAPVAAAPTVIAPMAPPAAPNGEPAAGRPEAAPEAASQGRSASPAGEAALKAAPGAAKAAKADKPPVVAVAPATPPTPLPPPPRPSASGGGAAAGKPGGGGASGAAPAKKPILRRPGSSEPAKPAGGKERGAKAAEGAKPDGVQKAKGTQTFVELRRPRPAQAEEPVAPVARRRDPRQEDEGPRDVLLAPPVLKLNRPVKPAAPAAGADPAAAQLQAKPTLPRKRTGSRWDDEPEDPDKLNKAANKTKRRNAEVVDDDDDFDIDDDDVLDPDAPVQVNLSLVRPPKPKGAAKTTAKPAAASAPKSRKFSGSRDRRDRRDQEVKIEKPEIIQLTGGVTVQDLASRIMMPETDIIRTLFFKGIAATITQTLDLGTARMVAEELGVLVDTTEKPSEAKKVTEMIEASDLSNLHRRPPVVTIMGHVDHGKTSLLDSIRKSKVAAGEAGGITQHIGAYHVDVEHNGANQQVVFLDTPGHEAFTAMRARGARVTDVAILVVAADDGVQPQTIEAISHAKAAEVPIIVAINKVDKEGAQPDRVKQELTEHNLVAEEWGGDTVMVSVSALTGENLDTLLEMILLVSEVEDLSANPDRPARGTVIEAHLDKAKGPVATLLVQNGTLRVGDTLVAGSALGKVRAMVDDRLSRVQAAMPSFAVEVLGLSDVPAAGDEFEVFADEKQARAVAQDRSTQQRESRLIQAMSSRRVSLNSLSAQAQEGELKELNLVLKADVQGSVEAILGSLKQLPQNEVQIRVLFAAPGEISETDVDLAAASSAVVVGFNTTLAPGARQAADRAGVDVRDYNIIYKLLDDIEAAMEGLLEPEMVEEPLGQVEVRAVFSVGKGAVAGCYVQSGKIIRNSRVRVHRKGEKMFEGNLDSLKRMRDDVKEVNSGYECGIGLDAFNSWQEGDIIEVFRMIAKRRTLTAAK